MLLAALAVPEVISFTVWGFVDADSWVPGFFTGEGYATIYDVNAQPKLAFYNLLEDLQIAAFSAPRRVRTQAPSNASGGTPGSSMCERHLDDPDDDQDHRDPHIAAHDGQGDPAAGRHNRLGQDVERRHPPVLPVAAVDRDRTLHPQ